MAEMMKRVGARSTKFTGKILEIYKSEFRARRKAPRLMNVVDTLAQQSGSLTTGTYTEGQLTTDTASLILITQSNSRNLGRVCKLVYPQCTKSLTKYFSSSPPP
jgi:hypothetical protein